ncbi:DUF551 domain-containing protein [Escherichia albertii]
MAKIIAHYPLGIDVGKQKFVQAIGELPDFGGYLFAAPPAPVVPEEISMASKLPLMSDQLMLVGYVKGWNACRAAMLQGSQPVSQTYKLNELAGNYPDIPVSAQGKGVTGGRIRIKPHVYRELVNRLHDTAIKCAGTQQLRERISRVLGDVITPDHHKQAEKSGLERCHLEAALNIKPGNGIEQATHWMPLPEPPQEVK